MATGAKRLKILMNASVNFRLTQLKLLKLGEHLWPNIKEVVLQSEDRGFDPQLLMQDTDLPTAPDMLNEV